MDILCCIFALLLLNGRKTHWQDAWPCFILLCFLANSEQRPCKTAPVAEASPKKATEAPAKLIKNQPACGDISETINEKYRGVCIRVLQENGLCPGGEVVFDFDGLIALKKGNRIVFVDPSSIDAFI